MRAKGAIALLVLVVLGASGSPATAQNPASGFELSRGTQRALFRLHLREVFPLVQHGATGDVERRIACKHLRERALARAVRAHDGMHLALADLQIDPFQDFLFAYRGTKAFDL